MTLRGDLLVVDDDAGSRQALSATLHQADVPNIALGTEGARAWLAEHVPPLVLLDLVTDRAAGYALLAELRAHPVRGEVPVLVLVARDAADEIAAALTAGADDYVPKPCAAAELLLRVRAQLRMLEYRERLGRRERDQQAEAERRMKLFQRYVDFFESAADGMLVIDRSGALLFANPRAREILALSGEELLGRRFPELVAQSERGRAERLLEAFAVGEYPLAAEFSLESRRREHTVISVSSSSVLHEDNAVLLTFRDVTRERKTAIELQQTKEFLERVIDSSVDGIVSANLRGTVLLFNRAASRIFGYAPEDVVGKMRVDRLYPPGGAREVMQKIRDPAICGYGRLEDHRVDMLGADGRIIPVLLSASLVMDSGRPVASVGIFTDIRDKLRIEAELERAQDELRAREKQALVAELAGAAAHELNQPLTSVLGYASLLRRQPPSSPKHAAALDVIIDQAERMADIVRKIGSITKYETKAYVGAARILDIEKATEEER